MPKTIAIVNLLNSKKFTKDEMKIARDIIVNIDNDDGCPLCKLEQRYSDSKIEDIADRLEDMALIAIDYKAKRVDIVEEVLY